MKADEDRVLLDSAALLDWFDDKPSAEIVENNIERSSISAVTLAVLASKIGVKVEPYESTRLLNLGLEVLDVDESVALEVARVSYATIAHNLGLEDLILLALARVHRRSVISGSESLIGVRLDRPKLISLSGSRPMS